MSNYDVIIIGAGVTGCAIAREISRYNLKTVVLEKNADICEGTSKANSGIIHAGYDAVVGTLKAKLNVQGSKMMPELAKKLDIPFIQNGAMVVCLHEQDRPKLLELYERGIANGVEGIRILTKEEAFALEPHLSEQTVAALYAPSSGIICPFELTTAFAENACENGVDFLLQTEVTNITLDNRDDSACRHYSVTAVQYLKGMEKNVTFNAACIINAAGVYADQIHNLICSDKIKIIPRRGEYCLLDVSAGQYVKQTIFRVPGSLGKGILVTPTVHGNLLVGPTAENIEDKKGVNTTTEGLKTVNTENESAVAGIPLREVITSFSGLRAHPEGDDFVIKESEEYPNFIDVAGIESPGLSASGAIGVMVADMVCKRLKPEKKESYIETRKGIERIKMLPLKERKERIRQNPAYGNIICRCSTVSEGEIIDSIHRPLGATTLDGVKRRTGAEMGRCQGGFCVPRIMEILSRELNVPYETISKCGDGSELITGRNKESDIREVCQ